MRKLLLVLLIASFVLLAGAAPAYAQRYGLTFTPVTVDTANALAAKTWVYGVGVYASSANAGIGLYDVATLGEVSDANLSAPEAGQATAGVSTYEPYEEPIYFETGVTAVVGGGGSTGLAVGYIVSGPAP